MLGRIHRGAGVALAVGAIAMAAPAAVVFADQSGGHGRQSRDHKGRPGDYGDHGGRPGDRGRGPGDHRGRSGGHGGSGDHGRHPKNAISHVLLISVDGLHQSDLEWYVSNHPGSELAKLVGGGAEYSGRRRRFRPTRSRE